VTEAALRVTSTEPDWSVRRTVDECSRSRASVEPAGWPKSLSAPTETIATLGLRAASIASDEAVALP